ncbi:uncharacterized protein LOC120630712 [Pararge aegeria]|uniref:uncharacterized protein LOC120630712 n=1 Tax=Pararge aegeria TaxID=116150 RepID=UPI0019D26A35|nr:uncharacterized protein LOC120630712 [Pararge aegeria]
MKLLLISVLALSSAITADPAVIFSGLLPPQLTSAALVAPGAAQLIPPVAPLPAISAYSPLASYSAVGPILSDYRYSYSSSYQDYYPVVNSALTLPYSSIPYAYSADWFYRK